MRRAIGFSITSLSTSIPFFLISNNKIHYKNNKEKKENGTNIQNNSLR